MAVPLYMCYPFLSSIPVPKDVPILTTLPEKAAPQALYQIFMHKFTTLLLRPRGTTDMHQLYPSSGHIPASVVHPIYA